MSLYLCVFRDLEELAGVDVGSYEDFDVLRQTICAELEDGAWGLVFPVLQLHSDCDGEWSPVECEQLRQELTAINRAFEQLPPREFHSAWQRELAQSQGLNATALAHSFIDVDGDPLILRLMSLCDIAISNRQAILFQ